MAIRQSMDSVSTQDDLCNWEFINQFDFEINGGDDDDIIYDLVESIDSLSSSSLYSSEDDDEEENEGPADEHRDDESLNRDKVLDLGQIHGCYDDDNLKNHVDDHHRNDEVYEFYDGLSLQLHRHHENDADDDVDDERNDDDVDDGYGIDDELVPWEVKDRFVRQRIRKSGKKSIGKMTKSTKKSALVFTRPGCVRGKHGLGLKVY